MKRANIGLMTFLLLALSTVPVMAQEGALVKLTSEVLREEIVVDESGTKITRLVPATRAIPGEVLTFNITYINEGEEEARDIVLTNPVPEQMVYEEGSAKGEGSLISYSVDGGVTYNAPDSLTITGDDGLEQRALPSDYTHIRWQLNDSVPPGGTGTVSFKASLK